MNKKLLNILLVVIFLAGLSLLLYPSVSNAYNNWLHSKAIVEYSNEVGLLEQATYDQELEKAQAYNRELLQRADPFRLTQEQENRYWELLSLSGKNIMAYVEIPSINVTLPIAHGTSEEVLQKYVGHISWSSLPVGGESTHCVLSGHRGLPSSELFTNIDHLELGDKFYIHTLGKVLEYQVCHIAVVEPHDQQLLLVEEGQDLVTLVTCTPYGINSHRLLVRGIRTGTDSGQTDGQLYIKNEVSQVDTLSMVAVILVIAAAIAFVVVLLSNQRKGGKKREKENLS